MPHADKLRIVLDRVLEPADFLPQGQGLVLPQNTDLEYMAEKPLQFAGLLGGESIYAFRNFGRNVAVFADKSWDIGRVGNFDPRECSAFFLVRKPSPEELSSYQRQYGLCVRVFEHLRLVQNTKHAAIFARTGKSAQFIPR